MEQFGIELAGAATGTREEVSVTLDAQVLSAVGVHVAIHGASDGRAMFGARTPAALAVGVF